VSKKPLVIDRSFTPKQLEFFEAVEDPAASEILFDRSIRAGKSQACCWQVFKWAVRYGGIYLIARNTFDQLRDSTRKVFVEGDGGLPPTCPPELIESFNRTDNVLRIRRPDGGEPGEVIFRAIGDDGLGRIKNISLAGAFIDHAEELDEGSDGEAMYDEILGRLSDLRGPRKLLAASNPGSTMHWVYRRFVKPDTREPQTRRVHVQLTDAAACLPPAYLERMLATKQTRPHWFKARILGLRGSFEGAAYVEFDERVHVVKPFPIPGHWQRFRVTRLRRQQSLRLAALGDGRGRQPDRRRRVLRTRPCDEARGGDPRAAQALGLVGLLGGPEHLGELRNDEPLGAAGERGDGARGARRLRTHPGEP
jgi:Phage terminase large subunit